MAYKVVNSVITDNRAIYVFPTGATGKSAYEIAVENGFSGTEADWINALTNKSANDWILEPAKTSEFDGVNKSFTTTQPFITGKIMVFYSTGFMPSGTAYTEKEDQSGIDWNTNSDAPNPEIADLFFFYLKA